MELESKFDNEKINGAFLTEIRTIGDRSLHMTFFTNYRIILVDLKTSNSIGVDAVMGPIYWLIKEDKLYVWVVKLVREAKHSIDTLFKNNKDIFEIRYDKILDIKYKYDEEYEIPLLKIHYSEPLRKSKDVIKMAILPDRSYRKVIIKEKMSSGNLSHEFGEDIMNILLPVLENKITLSKKSFWGG